MVSTIVEYYSNNFKEDIRLQLNVAGKIERIRTIDILDRFLPPSPAIILDIGGGTGAYTCWLLDNAYNVNLVDIVHAHIETAKHKLKNLNSNSKWTAAVGDACNLDFPDSSMDAVLLMGPLYHIQNSEKRILALSEAAEGS